jgi:Domain of unknown function (DUF1893)
MTRIVLGLVDVVMPLPIVDLLLIYVVLQRPPWLLERVHDIYKLNRCNRPWLTYRTGEVENMTEEQEPTLIVLQDGMLIFTSTAKWLHPLFELEDYLADHPVHPEHLILQDKIIGKAAALLIHRMGLRTVNAGILSRLGEAVLQRHGIAYTYEQLVDRIHCQTEELLAEVEDAEEAYGVLKVRAGR